MDPGSLSLRVIMVCLLGAARCSNGGDITCPCREISPLPLTEPPPQDCLHSRFRYTCLDGYLRKVGTSNLIKCTQQKIGGPKWSTPTLVCIADPKRTTTPTPERTVATSSIPNTIKSASTSASEATETNSATSASPGVQSEHSQVNFKETKATAWTTSTSTSTSTSTTPTTTTTTEPFNDTTHKADVHTSPRLGPTIPAVIICFSLLIVCALIGLRYICYRRRSRNNNPPATEEEKVAMSPVSLE
ncbi:interleukin-15 receptor subunit alpha isoform X2 [Toxotes jaculatrix]|uniref:interleukin-15 receptor subunit alpha isoform X2 n=1 Tax=Toxotes jaculatrix TaxID=941984 RepID=UPI001B3AB191|nr:interleukin-15 receptor subunit alpha isoform X2 [Toxotes jaculatrix]